MGVLEGAPSKDPSKYGLRIYKLIKNSPLDKSGLKEISDFIIPPPSTIINEKENFNDWILSIADKTIKLKIYSLKSRSFKEIEIKTNPIESKEGVLGAAVKYENFESAAKNLLHVVSVEEESFAQKTLGLIPNEDYIIAVKSQNYPIIPLNKEEFNPLEILNTIIDNYRGNNLMFYIYNVNKGLKIVDAYIDKEKKFVLGCDVAYGALHEFPQEQNEVNEDKVINEQNEEKENINKEEDNNDVNNNKEEVNNQKEEKNDKNQDINVVEEDII